MGFKDYLLKLNIVKDNEYLDKYISLLEANKDTKYLAGKTECHHGIPIHIYQDMYGYKNYTIARNRANKDINNIIVNLSYKDHMLAHYYLAMCSKAPYDEKNIYAFMLMTQNKYRYINEIDFNEFVASLEGYQIVYEQYYSLLSKPLSAETRKKISEANKGKKKPARTADHCKALKAARNLHSTTAGRKSIYNKELNKVKFVCENELEDYLSAGWVLGGKPLSDEAKRKIGSSNSIALKGKTHQPKKENKLNSGLTFNKVLCVETGQIFNNINEAKQWLKETIGIDGSQIKNCCAGQREMTGGYHWQYYKED